MWIFGLGSYLVCVLYVKYIASLQEYKSTGTLSRLRHNESSIFKRIPKGAEATSVLVGDLDYLDKPLMAFVRLVTYNNIVQSLYITMYSNNTWLFM